MELLLYGWLIRVSFILSKFLKSFEKNNTLSEDELLVIKRGRTVFKIVTINISIMAVTNSVFSAISPYLWLGDVYSKSNFFIQCFIISTTIFYLANTFFACLLLYVIHKFGLDESGNINITTARRDTEALATESTNRFSRVSPFLNIDDLDYSRA